jgi:hypothetical protein
VWYSTQATARVLDALGPLVGGPDADAAAVDIRVNGMRVGRIALGIEGR